MSEGHEADDPYLWLESVDGERATAWVRARNAEAESRLRSDPAFDRLRSGILDVLEADDRIAEPTRLGDDVLNFWTDANHPRGLLRRTTWDDYRGGNPTWETLLDVDALGRTEGESWVFAGVSIRHPDHRRAFVDLSPGGSDTTETREFDLVERRFVPVDEGGFFRPLSKGELTWIDDDAAYVASDFGAGTMTRSGYPRTIRRWRRGTPMIEAEPVFEGDVNDVGVGVAVSTLPGDDTHRFTRSTSFFTSRTFVLRSGSLVEVPVPDHAMTSVRGGWVVTELREPWTVAGVTFAAGSLLAAPLDEVLAGPTTWTEVFVPSDDQALSTWSWTRNLLVVVSLRDVRRVVEVADPEDGWRRRPPRPMPDVWTIDAEVVDADAGDDLWLYATDFLTPTTLYHVAAGEAPVLLRQSPSRFDADCLRIEQHFAASVDGTRVPYFVVRNPDVDGPRPTILRGYGGFESPELAAYSGGIGRSWLADGGVYAVANIRGGGEYGPRWHQAGLREHRHRVFEDFEAVARDLVERGITSPDRLGCTGGSNGGLLVGNMYVRSPELWGAIACGVPLLDMRRYTKLLAGASWAAEYGDPDTDDWAFIRTFSPYHLVDPEVDHPPILLYTSTRDDRVHPGHARKMAHKLADLGKDVTYWENTEGGHGGGADAPQLATMEALRYTFFRQRLGLA